MLFLRETPQNKIEFILLLFVKLEFPKSKNFPHKNNTQIEFGFFNISLRI